MKKNLKKICWRWNGDISEFKTDYLVGETKDRLMIRYICCPIALITPKKSQIEYYFPKKETR